MSTLDALLQVPLARSLAAAVCGAFVGLGLWVAVAATRDWLPQWGFLPGPAGPDVEAPASARGGGQVPRRTQRQVLAAGLLAGLLTAGLLQLPVVALLVVGAVLVGLDLVAGPPMRELNELGAAIAAWSETVRQELEAGQPQRAALLAACDMPPPGLEEHLALLAERLENTSIPEALWAFARDVNHPAAGHTVAALDVAYRYGAADLPRLMAGQVETTRHQVQMMRELHAARAKHRRAMLLLLALFFAVIVGLFVAWPHFLAAYRDLQGQAVLAAIGAAVLFAVRSLVRLSQASPPPNFFTGPRPDHTHETAHESTSFTGGRP
jgi:Flp pilus assembly protein TadB